MTTFTKTTATGILLLCFLAVVTAFAPAHTAVQKSVTFQPARRIHGTKPTHIKQTIVLRMSEEKETEEPAAVAPPKGAAFYDDEVGKIMWSSNDVYLTGWNLVNWYGRASLSNIRFLLLFFWQYDSAPVKAGLSDSMKARLMAEAATGLDSEKKQTNVILYIMAAVGVLVILGGQGIFY